MNKKNLTIVGLGLIGGSYAKCLAKLNKYNLYAIDTNIETITKAYNDNIILNKDNDSLTTTKILSQTDILIICLYPSSVNKFLRENQHLLKPHTVITDVTGIKEYIIDDIKNDLRKDLYFVPSHPMAGSEKVGYENSKEDLFLNANFIITPYLNSNSNSNLNLNYESSIDVIKELGKDLKFKYIEILTPSEHDDIIGFLSQLTHIIAIALMNTHETESFIRYTGDSFRDLTRIAKINSPLWSELFLNNKEVLLREIKDFKNALTIIENTLQKGDENKLKEILEKSKETRELFDR